MSVVGASRTAEDTGVIPAALSAGLIWSFMIDSSAAVDMIASFLPSLPASASFLTALISMFTPGVGA